MLGALGVQDLCLLGAFGLRDRCLPVAFGGQDHRPLLPVGLHLLFHRGLNRRRRVDAAQLHPGHPQAPAAGRLVEHTAQLGVDLVAGGQGLLQRHAAHHVAQGGGGELLDSDDVVADLVHGRLRNGDLEVDDGVDVEGQVVLGDDRLRRERHHPLAQVDPRADAVDEWHQQRELATDRATVTTQPFDHGRLGLRDQRNGLGHHDDREGHQNGQKQQNHKRTHRRFLSRSYPFPKTTAVAPSMRKTVTESPGS